MELDNDYGKYIKGKTNPVAVVKSRDLSGTLAALYRILYLKSNYCLYDRDKILYIAKDKDFLRRIKESYENLKGKDENSYITLFSFLEDRTSFVSIDDLINEGYKKYALKNPEIKLIDEIRKREIIGRLIESIRDEFRDVKLFKKDVNSFIYDEINWIKYQGFREVEAYQSCQRAGRKYKKGEGPGSIRKNSRTREAIFKLYLLYEEELNKNSLIDKSDVEGLAALEIHGGLYTHIVVDESRSLTKKELEIIRNLKNNTSYGETTYIYNNESEENKGFLTKPARIREVEKLCKIRSFKFKAPIDGEKLRSLMPEESIMNRDEIKENYSVENFEFISLKNRSEFKFLRDITRKDSIVLVDGEGQEELQSSEMKEIPIFSDIAAGEPILMNPDVEDTFYLPEYWVKGRENHFILHVKGDSMINANIKDGDYVVIKSSQSAQNRDIVAVDIDGSATLKRLMIKGSTAMLMPENERYRPIVITEEGANILGIAVGIIKEK